MKNLPMSIFEIGNIVGIGESSHGSKTEFELKFNCILEVIRSKPGVKFVCCLEEYADPITDLLIRYKESIGSIEEHVMRCIQKMHSFGKDKESYNFILSLVKLIIEEQRDIHIVGIDFQSKEHKKSFDKQKMLEMRDGYMSDNVIKSYDPKAVNFICAHNAHIGRYFGEWDTMGYFLSQKYRDEYIPIAQHVSSGSVWVEWNSSNYQSVDFAYENLPGSVTEFSSTLFLESEPASNMLILSTLDPRLEYVNTIQQMGFYLPLDEPWIMPFGKEYFEYIVLHKNSESAEPLLDNNLDELGI